MATWTNIANQSLEPGSPARSVDAFALRDNPIAIAEGAAGAPRIQTNAIQNSAVNAAKIANSAVDAAKLKTNTTSISMSVPGDATRTINLGPYAFLPNLGASNTFSFSAVFAGDGGGDADSPRIRVLNSDNQQRTFTIQWRRVIA